MELHLIPASDACCNELSGSDAYIGVTVMHPDPEDGCRHELDVYWRQCPPGRQQVTLVAFEPLAIAEDLRCYCGWSGRIEG